MCEFASGVSSYCCASPKDAPENPPSPRSHSRFWPPQTRWWNGIEVGHQRRAAVRSNTLTWIAVSTIPHCWLTAAHDQADLINGFGDLVPQARQPLFSPAARPHGPSIREIHSTCIATHLARYGTRTSLPPSLLQSFLAPDVVCTRGRPPHGESGR